MDYQISLHNRGELIRYVQGERYREAEVLLRTGSTLNTWHAQHWKSPPGEEVTEPDRKIAVERLVEYLVGRGAGPVRVIHQPPESEQDRFDRLRREGIDVHLENGKVIYKRDQFTSAVDLRKRR